MYKRINAGKRIYVYSISKKSKPYLTSLYPIRLVERLIKSIRHELLDQTLFWNGHDLQKKLESYQHYFNLHRSHTSLNTVTPAQKADQLAMQAISIDKYQWW